ncbi:hypothetical protein [uncultured Ruegeria sp.]|uniref:hypothetical protein n=1 Tax=uncultured Ruegeria sp. TaxID=259304 RepID=UPI00262761F8|nr:hypothetical protein [uncultured Ruegeria sp.]
MHLNIVPLVFLLLGLVATPPSAVAQENFSNAQIGRAVSALLWGLKEVETSHADLFDPAMIAKALPPDPIAARDWVSENTSFVPYQGSLKGGSGVLVDREGNSLDRALLLVALLEEKGFQTRLCLAKLTDESTRLIYDNLAPVRISRIPDAQRFDPKSLEEQLVGPGNLPPEYAKSLIVNIVSEIENTDTKLSNRLASVLPAVTSAARYLERPTMGVVMPRQHWWVEVREGETWRVLDPSVPALGENLEPTATFAPEALPSEFQHRVTLSVVVEVTSDARVEETVLVSIDRTASELANSTLAVSFFPIEWEDLSGETRPEDVLLFTKSWVPVINMEEEEIVDLGFNLDGATQDSDKLKSENGLTGASGALGGLLGGLNSEIGSNSSTSTSTSNSVDRITGLWLRLETNIPGRKPEEFLRVIFDAAPMTPPGHLYRPSSLAQLPNEDDAKRLERSLAMLGVHKLGVATARWPEAYHAIRIAQLLEFQAPAMKAIRDGATLSANEANEFAKVAQRTSSKLLEYNFQRWALNPSADRLYLDGPSIAFEHVIYASKPEGIGVVSSFDIVRNEVAVRGSPDIDEFSERLAQGVTDTVAESVFENQSLQIGNTARLHELLASTEWKLLMPGDVVPDSSAPRLSMALQRGRAILMPTSEADQGLWWEINLANGTTLGVSETGYGEAVEFILEKAVTQFVYCGVGQLALGVYQASDGGTPISERFDQTGREVLVVGCSLGTIGIPGLGWLLRLKSRSMTHVQGIATTIIILTSAIILSE